MNRVARANPDGHTLAFSASFSTHVVHGAIHKLPYDVVDDFEPVALATDGPMVMLAKKAMPANDLNGLIGWLRANPDKASLGQTGPGSPAHVAGLLFQRQTGSRFLFANYRSAGQAMQDLVAGHIDLMLTAPNIALEHVRAGSIKAYAVTDKSRLASAPEVPTVDEAGLQRVLCLALACILGAQGHAAGGDRQAQCRRRGCLGRYGRAQAAQRCRAGDFPARAADTGSAPRLSARGNRTMVADPQGGWHQGGISPALCPLWVKADAPGTSPGCPLLTQAGH